MGSYTFDQRCRPRGNFRIREVLEFLELVQEAFRCPDLYDSRSNPVDLSEAGLQKIFETEAKRRGRGTGIEQAFFTIPPRKRDNNTIRIEISTGYPSDGIFIDAYNIDMSDGKLVPDFDWFEKSIKIFKPFEAYVAEGDNEFALDTYDRQSPKFDKPAIIRGFHYLDEGMARSIGGIEHCLKAPAWHVERFCEGVLIELVPGLFDNDNPEHLRVQDEVMDYFDLP
jgi:hypothetical protein